MSSSPAIEELFERACPSIRYRVREEILGESEAELAASGLIEQILEDPLVAEVLRWRRADGWLGGTLHSGSGPETGIRVLSEKGLKNHPVVADALLALKKRGDAFDAGCLERVGKALDEHHLGGSKMILAAVLSYARIENEPLVQEQIAEALEGFRSVLSVDSIDSVARPHKKYLVFREGARWPSLYHLRLLAFTRSWRTDENTGIVTEAVSKMVSLSPIPQVHLLCKSQIMAPASVFMLDFAPDMRAMKAQDWMAWFHRTEMLSRLGVIARIPGLDRQVEQLNTEFMDGDGFFSTRLNHYYFHRWSGYTGLALERD